MAELNEAESTKDAKKTKKEKKMEEKAAKKAAKKAKKNHGHKVYPYPSLPFLDVKLSLHIH